MGDFNMDSNIFRRLYPQQEKIAPGELWVSRASGSDAATHGHNFLELAYIFQGAISQRFEDRTSTVRAGEYFIVDQGTTHAYTVLPGEPLKMVNVMFFPHFLDRMLIHEYTFPQLVNSYLLQFNSQTLRSSPTGVTLSDPNGRVGDLIEHIAREYVEKDDGYLEYIRGLLIEVLVITLRRIGRREKSVPMTGTVSEILRIVQNRYSEKLSLSDIARELNYSLPSLSRKFRQETGTTFSTYLQKVRIDRSCQLLTASSLTISEISSQVGYEDLSFFNGLFKKAMGVTPRQFRKTHRY